MRKLGETGEHEEQRYLPDLVGWLRCDDPAWGVVRYSSIVRVFLGEPENDGEDNFYTSIFLELSTGTIVIADSKYGMLDAEIRMFEIAIEASNTKKS